MIVEILSSSLMTIQLALAILSILKNLQSRKNNVSNENLRVRSHVAEKIGRETVNIFKESVTALGPFARPAQRHISRRF